ncbi:MAG: pantetheine-phosphate adenylyltransferase [Longimicrobiaceae bacterium]
MNAKSRIAVCPGSFDPVTLGHEEIVQRSLRFADRVIVAVGHRTSQEKRGLFSVRERLELIRQVFAGEDRIEAAGFEGLLVDFARERGARLVVRGLRAVSDFEYEFQMALMNRELWPELETVFLAPDAEHSFLSSSLVREIAGLGGDVSRFVSPPVLEGLRGKFAGA